MAYLSRLAALVGEEKLAQLKNCRVMVCGVGGVGGFVCEALARSGVGELIIVDFDRIDASNLNRQLVSTIDNIGELKVEAMKRRLENVSTCKVKAVNAFIDEDFELEAVDYVVDCIDTLNSKFALVKKAHARNIPILSSMGSALRMEIRNIKRTTLDKTRNDPLAKAFRNLVKKSGYRHKIAVVYADTPAQKRSGEALGSSIFVVGSVGLFIADEVFKDLLGK